MTDNEISTEDLLNMRVVPEQREDLAAVQEALQADPAEELRRMTYQRDAWRFDALAAEQRIDALNERLADRDAQLDQAKTARARDLVRYSQDEMFLRLMAAEADRDAAEAALAQLTGITPLFAAAPVGGQAEPSDVLARIAELHKRNPLASLPADDPNRAYFNADDICTECAVDWPCDTAKLLPADAVSGEHQDATGDAQ